MHLHGLHTVEPLNDLPDWIPIFLGKCKIQLLKIRNMAVFHLLALHYWVTSLIGLSTQRVSNKTGLQLTIISLYIWPSAGSHSILIFHLPPAQNAGTALMDGVACIALIQVKIILQVVMIIIA
ncbi:hypothetical protein BGX38DRAFT_1195139 [Terfezia claveryi]|nr:hypothetical protein BGX38DRAFT_1195139 [Terfezia claveryi]